MTNYRTFDNINIYYNVRFSIIEEQLTEISTLKLHHFFTITIYNNIPKYAPCCTMEICYHTLKVHYETFLLKMYNIYIMSEYSMNPSFCFITMPIINIYILNILDQALFIINRELWLQCSSARRMPF